MGVKGYKVFNTDWTCRDKVYAVGQTFEEYVKPEICNIGMHFCTKLSDCFRYYDYDNTNHVAEVEAIGDVAYSDEDSKCATNKLTIIRELKWKEVVDLCNIGDGNSGNRNSGNRNSGNWNSGDWNSGDWNIGDGNSGNRNSGNWNSGNWNSGNWNSGNWNSGNWNSGDWNDGSYLFGAFNTKKQTIKMFDKDTDITLEEWFTSDVRRILNDMPGDFNKWIFESEMTDEEKEANPSYKTTGGYLKWITVTNKDRQKWYDNLSFSAKDLIKSMPNFNKTIFKKITGINAK